MQVLNFSIVLPPFHGFVKSIPQFFYEYFVNFNTHDADVPKSDEYPYKRADVFTGAKTEQLVFAKKKNNR